jgi:outer membrane protein OmpA-like peptidoglycan-associated protein/opacity protein-like surface antigen
MKKFTLLLISLFILGSAFAQNADKKWAIGLGPGYYMPLNEDLGNNWGANFYLSRYLNPSFDLLLKGDLGWMNKDENKGEDVGVGDFSFWNGSLNARWNIVKEGKFKPYLAAGPGFIQDKGANRGMNINAAIGSRIPISANTSLFLEAAYITKQFGEPTKVNDAGVEVPVDDLSDKIKVSGIIEFAFGKAKDSDGDGVPDKRDKCPDTPPGVAVDENGCPLDRDGDGVPDYKDDCPDQPGDAKFNGCPDTDGDGIPDKDDDCPTVAGLAKFKGCPDTDEDGVPDPKDKCPNTPKGCPVDANGCPLDSDGDGVIDCEDKCPNEAGPASNSGCPEWTELVVPTIYFDLDKSDLKPEGKAELDKIVQTLIASKEFNIVIGGHACDLGTDAYNMKLSEERAQEVVKYLLSKGVNNAYIGSNNYGEREPAVPNTSEDNRKKNRRVEWEVAKVKKN